MEQLTAEDAASRLGISRRRVDALILSGALHAEKVGNQWLIPMPAYWEFERVRPLRRGRRLTARQAWARIAAAPELLAAIDEFDDLDRERRELRTRADHLPFHVHDKVLGGLEPGDGVVLGGRRAAAAAGAPVEPGEVTDVYVPVGHLDRWKTLARARVEVVEPNVVVHAVADDQWVHLAEQLYVDLFVAWLDLADRGDRTSDLVLDRVLGGRPRA